MEVPHICKRNTAVAAQYSGLMSESLDRYSGRKVLNVPGIQNIQITPWVQDFRASRVQGFES
ncbi:hypothetical protein E2C01_052048 [Portunus trituberculatus]|uniref:Uncharacterized protein n=1 Tax=Portunus trituberculatus TaxID=210409 RepID=A0A5B7GKI7_PORTR|nr:hypothetical protein [Portunus trituberculatus]